jgi:hypothetical protein
MNDKILKRTADHAWSRLPWDEQMALRTMLDQRIMVTGLCCVILGLLLGIAIGMFAIR